jgi:hypothetical protein
MRISSVLLAGLWITATLLGVQAMRNHRQS